MTQPRARACYECKLEKETVDFAFEGRLLLPLKKIPTIEERESSCRFRTNNMPFHVGPLYVTQLLCFRLLVSLQLLRSGVKRETRRDETDERRERIVT